MNAIRGVCAAVLTPLTNALEPDAAKAIPYYARLLANGVDALNVLGTTGECWSLSLAQRIDYMEKIAQSELPLNRMMVGTAAWNIEDTIELTRAAIALGFAGSLIMPRLPQGERSGDAVVAYFDELFAKTSPKTQSIYLYNFPKVSGLAFTPDLVARLAGRFSEAIAGVKDSSNDLPYALELARLGADLAIFPSSESHLLFAREQHLAGCISGTVCLWPQLAQAVWSGDAAQAQMVQAHLTQLRETTARAPLISAVRALTAKNEHDPAWQRETVSP